MFWRKKRSAKRPCSKAKSRLLRVEPLETRQMLSGTVNILLGASGALSLQDSSGGAGNNISIQPSTTPSTPNSYAITANSGTQLTLAGVPVASPYTATGIYGNITIDLGAGTNVLNFSGPTGSPPSANPVEGNVVIDDTVNDTNTLANLQILGSVTFNNVATTGTPPATNPPGDANYVNNTFTNDQFIGPVTMYNGATNTTSIGTSTFYQGLYVYAPPSTVSTSSLTITSSTLYGPSISEIISSVDPVITEDSLTVDNTNGGTTNGSCTTSLSLDTFVGGVSITNGNGQSQTTISGCVIQGQLAIKEGIASGAGNRVTIQPSGSVLTVIGTDAIETAASSPFLTGGATNTNEASGDAVVITNGTGGSFTWFDGTSGDPVTIMGGINIVNGSSLTSSEQTNVNVVQFTYTNVSGAANIQDGLDGGSSLQTEVNTFNSNLGSTKRVDLPSPMSVQNAGGYATFQMTSSDAPWGVAVDNDALSPTTRTFWGSSTTVSSSGIGDGPWGPRLDVSLSKDTTLGDAFLLHGDNGSDAVNITTSSKINGTAQLNLYGGSNTVLVSAATMAALNVNTGLSLPGAARPGLDSVSISGSTISAGLFLNLLGIANSVTLSDGGTPGGETLPDLYLGNFEIVGGGVATATDTLTVSADLLSEVEAAIAAGLITNFSTPVVH
jgi:hypothetical protein